MRIADYDDCHEVDVRELFGKPVSTDARYWHVGPYNQLTIPKEHIDALNSFGLEYVGRILFVENFGYYFYVKGTVSRWVNAYAKLDWLE